LVTSPSGNHRLVWEFATPCSLLGCEDKFMVSFLAEFKRLCRLGSVLAGLDDAAYTRPSTYYDAAGTWTPVNSNQFPISDVDGVFFSAVRKSSKESDTTGLVEIPMDAVKDRLEELFPGRWPNEVPFVDGCRGPAVWDMNATNPTTTIYTMRGAFRFSQGKGFYPYSEILGKDFVRQWEDNKLGQATKAFYYCANGAKNYYVRIGGSKGAWEPQNLGDVQRRLVNNWRLSRKPPSVNDVSEVEQAIQFIQDNKKIDGLIPFVFDKRESLFHLNKKFLNSSRVRPMEPAMEAVDQRKISKAQKVMEGKPTNNRTPAINYTKRHAYRWGTGFPWIASWLTSWFGRGSQQKQLVYLLAWLKQGYEGAREGSPQKGHALFLVGGTNRGKTLFNGEFMTKIFGASTDASSFLLGKSSFNKELLESGYWRVDDAVAAIDKNSHIKFTEEVKRFVANPTVEYHPKYVDSQSVPFNGRLCITLNEDEESLRMIPDLDRNIADKLIILRIADQKRGIPFAFPDRASITANLNSQLPYFLRWLINWTPPAVITKGHTRFGMRNFIHEKVRLSSLSSGLDSDLFDIMAPLWESDDDFISKKHWEGTAAQLLGVLIANPVTHLQARGLTTRSLGRKLSTLASIVGSGVEKSETLSGASRLRSYVVKPPEFVTAHEENTYC